LTEPELAALAVHPDFLQPHTEQVSFKLPKLMYTALKSRSLTSGVSIGFLIRDCIRAGAPRLTPPLSVTGAAAPAPMQEVG